METGMKKLQGIAIVLLAVISASVLADTVKSCVINKNQLPIRQLALNPACQLQVTYRFQPDMNVLLCLSNVLKNSGTITWAYHGKTHTADLPVILSKKGGEQDVLIDESGKFSINNNQKSQLVISCQFSHGVAQAGRIRDLVQSAIRSADKHCARREWFA
jgi:hypothetical protein